MTNNASNFPSAPDAPPHPAALPVIDLAELKRRSAGWEKINAGEADIPGEADPNNPDETPPAVGRVKFYWRTPSGRDMARLHDASTADATPQSLTAIAEFLVKVLTTSDGKPEFKTTNDLYQAGFDDIKAMPTYMAMFTAIISEINEIKKKPK